MRSLSLSLFAPPNSKTTQVYPFLQNTGDRFDGPTFTHFCKIQEYLQRLLKLLEENRSWAIKKKQNTFAGLWKSNRV